MAPGDPEPFEVSLPGHVRDRVRRRLRWAAVGGFLESLTAALRDLHTTLAERPRHVGEFRYPLDGLQMDVRWTTFDMLEVGYAVHRTHRFVVIRSLRIRADFPHGQPPDADPT